MSIKNLLAELQKEYLASFPDKIENIKKHWKDQSLWDLHTEYHKLKGTGRSYGLPEVTQLGEAMEFLCEADQEALETAIPMSLGILEKIREHRTRGVAYNLDDDRDYQVIIQFVVDARRAG